MKTPDQTPFAPFALAAQSPPFPNRRRPHQLARLARLPALLLLCLGGLFSPLGAGAQSQPVVTLFEVPADVLIGENFTFKIKFKNLSTTSGYGPFIDLVLDAAGADAGTPPGPCDGVSFVSARLLTGGPLTLGTIQRLAPCPTTFSSACVPLFSHPFGAAAPLSPVGAKPGSELQTIILPFGHYESTQPELEIEVTARVSVLADALFPLSLSVRGGFRYGDSPTGTAPTLSEPLNPNSCSWMVQTTVNPTVMKVGKRYMGPEWEAASGPNFVSYYPLQYALTNDIAAGQTITNLVLEDVVPPTLVYGGNVTVTIHGNLAVAGVDYVLTAQPLPLTPQNAPSNVLTVTFLHPITGTAMPDDIVVRFEFFIPEFDANGNPILGPGCAMGITNVVRASGDWTPVDVRDVGPVHLVAGPATNIITAKCMAVQKTVRFAQPGDYPGALAGDLGTNGPNGLTPGDLLRYEINFQISDYKTIGDLVLTDWLSDGQVLDVSTAPFPRLTVQDQFGAVQGDFNVANFGTAPGQAWRIDTNALCTCTPPNFPSGLRADRYTFNISRLVMNQAGTYPRHAAGVFTGGLASLPGSPTPAVGTLVFYARVADSFIYAVPGDSFVDKHDPLVNCVVIQGTLYPNLNAPAVPVLPAGTAPITTSDDSGTGLRIVSSPFTKTIYAVNGLTNGFLNPPHLAPGDTVTFRLTKTIPSGDAENVVLRDFPPLPVLKVTDPTGNGSNTPWTMVLPGVLPPAGSWSVGLGHTAPVPSFTSITPNELTFTVGSFNNPLNTPRVVEIYFTMKMSADPIADGLFLTNEALEREANSFNETFAQVSLAQIKTAEPNLRLTKGVVATDDAGAVFTRPGLGALVFSPPGTAGCPRFSGVAINSATLPAFPQLTSDICHLRTNARVTFAIVVENLGSSPFGAFDVTILDTLPACFRNPQNLCITDGNGTNLGATGGLFTTGLNLTDVPGSAAGPGMGAVGPFDLTSGRNIAVITFDAEYVGGCCANHAQLLGYSNQEGGSNFVTAGLVAQASDDAGICCDVLTVNWPPDKTVQCGSAWTFGVPVALSSCSGANATITILSTATNGPRCSPIITRTWQVTDACLNTTNHVQTVTVVDTTPPVLTCVAGKTVQCGDKWVFDAPTASDACSGTNVTITILSTVTNGTACAQQFTRTWLAVDACGNTNTCSQTVTIVDTTPPIFVSAPGAGTGTGTTGTFSALAAWQTAAGMTTTIDFSTQDNGNPITPGTDTFFASLLLSGAEFVNVRSYYNSFIYVGANAPIRVNLPAGTFSFGADLGLFYSAVGGYSITLSDGQVLAAPYTGQDFFGFVSATPIAWVEFRFTNSGVLLMDNFYFGTPIPAAPGPAEKTVLCGTAWSFDAPTAYDVCGGTNVTITVLSTVTNGPCPRITRTWAATDACGNSSTISQTVIIVDTTPPTLICAPEKTVQCGTIWRFDPPVVTDGCSGTNVTLIVVSTVTNGTCPQVITRTWQAVDPCGNKSTNTCSQTVTVVDTTPPTITCAPEKTVQCGTAWRFDAPVASDSCSGTNVTITIVSTVTNGLCPQVITRTWRVTDACGNSATCTQTVTVIDTTPPVFGSATGQSYGPPLVLPGLGADPVQAYGINDAGQIVGSSFGNPNNGLLWTPTSGAYVTAPLSLPKGPASYVVAFAINSLGQVVGADNGYPNAAILWTPSGSVYGAPAHLPAGVAAAINTSGVIVGVATGGGVPVYWTPVSGVYTLPTPLPLGGMTGLAPAGINDAGVIVGGAVIWVPTLGVYGAPTLLPMGNYVSVAANGINAAGQIVGVGNAGAGERPIVWTPISGVYGPPVELPISNNGPWRATGINAAGQIVGFDGSSGTGVIWFPRPAADCPANKTVECGTAWTFDTPTAFDVCSGTNVTITFRTITNGLCPLVLTRIWVATDACGNTNMCSQTVTVVDTTPPLFICSTNKTVQCGTAWTFDAPIATDRCNGTNVTITIVSTVTNGTCPQVITRTWQAVDPCDNKSTNTCSQTVRIEDTTPPRLLGCQNLTTNAFPGLHGNYVTYAITAVDTCPGAVTVTCLPPSGTFFPIGTNQVICTAVDACGNTSTCEFTVIVGPPVDPCVLIVRELILCRTNGGYSYTFSVTNQGTDTIAGLVFVDLPAGMTVTPAAIALATPLAPGQGTTVTTTIHISAPAPANLCFRIMAHDKAYVECCIVQRCLTFPECKTLGPTLGDAVFVGGRFTFTLWAEMGVIYHVEYSTSLSPPMWLLSQTVVGNGSMITIMPRSDMPAPRLFYRVRQE